MICVSHLCDKLDNTVMELAYHILLLMVYPHGSSASSFSSNSSVMLNYSDPTHPSNAPNTTATGVFPNYFHEYTSGCSLHIPWSVTNRWESEGTPLSIFIDTRVLNVRDVPDSGGSFGVDI